MNSALSPNRRFRRNRANGIVAPVSPKLGFSEVGIQYQRLCSAIGLSNYSAMRRESISISRRESARTYPPTSLCRGAVVFNNIASENSTPRHHGIALNLLPCSATPRAKTNATGLSFCSMMRRECIAISRPTAGFGKTRPTVMRFRRNRANCSPHRARFGEA